MRLKSYYVIRPEYLWRNIVSLAHTNSKDLLNTLESSFEYIENESLDYNFSDLFSSIDLSLYLLCRTHEDRNSTLCDIITKISMVLNELSTNLNSLEKVYEFLLEQFARVPHRKYQEFYTVRSLSDIPVL